MGDYTVLVTAVFGLSSVLCLFTHDILLRDETKHEWTVSQTAHRNGDFITTMQHPGKVAASLCPWDCFRALITADIYFRIHTDTHAYTGWSWGYFKGIETILFLDLTNITQLISVYENRHFCFQHSFCINYFFCIHYSSWVLSSSDT